MQSVVWIEYLQHMTSLVNKLSWLFKMSPQSIDHACEIPCVSREATEAKLTHVFFQIILPSDSDDIWDTIYKVVQIGEAKL